MPANCPAFRRPSSTSPLPSRGSCARARCRAARRSVGFGRLVPGRERHPPERAEAAALRAGALLPQRLGAPGGLAERRRVDLDARLGDALRLPFGYELERPDRRERPEPVAHRPACPPASAAALDE